MAGVEKIKERILQDCDNSVSSILADAKKQAEIIMNKGLTQAEEKAATVRKKAANEAAEKERIANSMAELDMRKSVLLTKQEVINEVFDAALERLASLESGEYQKVVLEMLVSSIETGDEEVLLSDSGKSKISGDFIEVVNRALVQAGKKGNVKLSDAAANIKGGFILKSQGTEINNSFEALLRMYRDDIEPKVAQILF